MAKEVACVGMNVEQNGLEMERIRKFMARSVNVAMTRLASVAHCLLCSGSTGRLTLTVAWKCRMYSPFFFCFFFSNFF